MFRFRKISLYITGHLKQEMIIHHKIRSSNSQFTNKLIIVLELFMASVSINYCYAGKKVKFLKLVAKVPCVRIFSYLFISYPTKKEGPSQAPRLYMTYTWTG
jgi:hypothetical protein